AAAIEMRAEDQHHGFATYGDSVWWGIVTITTVGYGDVVPQTTLGRVVATVLMFTGVALLGTVAASLAAMFRVEDQAVEDSSRTGVGAVTGGGEAAGGPGRDGVPADPTTMSDVSTELRALRAEVAALREELGRRT
ncbi:MAG: potassium channel family protein, partial [Actinomycetota bacterium]